MTQVSVGLGARSYEIVIEANALNNAGATLAPYARNGRLTLVTDSNVASHVLPRLSAGLATAIPCIMCQYFSSIVERVRLNHDLIAARTKANRNLRHDNFSMIASTVASDGAVSLRT